MKYNITRKDDPYQEYICVFSTNSWKYLLKFVFFIRQVFPNLYISYKLFLNERYYSLKIFQSAVIWAGKKYIYQLTRQDFLEYVAELERV